MTCLALAACETMLTRPRFMPHLRVEIVEPSTVYLPSETEVRVRRRYAQLGRDAIHPHSLLCFSQAQYNNREAWNRERPGPMSWVPEPFDDTREIDWTPVWSFTGQTFKYIPTALCYFHYLQPGAPCFGLPDSNGMASASGGTTGCNAREWTWGHLTSRTCSIWESTTRGAGGSCGCWM